MRENRLWRKICAHVLSVFMILSMVGTALPGIGVLPAEEAYAAAAGISTATKGQMVNLGPTMAPDGYNCSGAASQWTVLDVQDAEGNSTTDPAQAARVLMITKDVWMSYDDYTGEDLGVAFADLDKWCEGFYADVLNSDARIASADGKHAFCLTKDQVNSMLTDNNARAAASGNEWWTATNIGTSNAWIVKGDGSFGAKQMTLECNVRPAVYLDLTKVTCSKYFKAWNLYDKHDFGKWTKKDDEKHQRTCSRDGFVEEADHTWDEGVVADGVKTYTCADCGATKTEEVAPEKPAIETIDIDDFTYVYMSGAVQPAADGVYAWVIEFPEGAATSEITDADFKMQMKTADSDWADSSDASAHFDFNENGAWVVGTVADNTEAVEKQWRFVYTGGGAECPAITQEAAETTDPLEEAKAAAKSELDNINTSDYSGEEKAAVEAAISKALEDIEAAETVDAVNDALETAKAAVQEQKTNAQKAEDAEKAANEAKTAADTAAAAAAESKAAAEEAAKTPGQAAVDAAEKAKKDADAAKEAADAYKEAAEAYADAAELAYGETAKKTEDAKKAAADAATAAEAAAQAATDAAKAVETAKSDKAKADEGASSAAAEAKAKAITSVTVNAKKVNTKAVEAAVTAAGGKTEYVTEIVLGKNVKKISKNTFKGTNVNTLVVKSKKLSKKSVKGSLKGSKIKNVQVKVGKKKVNKKYVKKYKKIFTKKNAGKKVKIR